MFDTLTGGKEQGDYQRLPGNLGAKGDFDRLPGNFKETDHTRQNLTDAFRKLEPKLLAMGIARVDAGSVALAKSALTPGLTINVDDDIQSNSLVEVQLTFRDGRPDEVISFDAWEDPDNHLSGAATVDTFVRRISTQLGIPIIQDGEVRPEQAGVTEDRQNFNWGDWGEGRVLQSSEFLSRDFLLPNDPKLQIREGQRTDGLTTYEIHFPGNSTIIVEFLIENQKLQDGASMKYAQRLRERIDRALEKAMRSGVTEVA